MVLGKMKGGLGQMLLADAFVPTPKFDSAVEITIDAFIKDVLPMATGLQLLLKNQHVGNFVSLTGGDGPERLFKWDNNFAWSYAGEVTDSIKERVKRAGGRVDGAKMRVSLSWFNFDDLDIHCMAPNGHIFYNDKRNVLDVDMNAGGGRTREPVENLSWMGTIVDGVYKVFVNQFSKRETSNPGFIIEIETGEKTVQLNYTKSMAQGENVEVVVFEVRKGVVVEMINNTALSSDNQSKDIWSVKTETLVPVEILLNSPNHWGDQAEGLKHWFFMLKGCKNPDATRGIYNEYLRPDLEKHRKVFELIGSKTKCEPTDNQLSGVGFTANRGDEVTLVAKMGKNSRPYTIKF